MIPEFRAWDRVNNRMGYFKPGFVWNDEYYIWHLVADGEPDLMDVPCGENIILEQFIGLHDNTRWDQLSEVEREKWTRDGNMPSDWRGYKLYEGDKITWDSENITETWIIEKTNGGWNPFIDDMTTDKAHRYKKIGTIHDQEKR